MKSYAPDGRNHVALNDHQIDLIQDRASQDPAFRQLCLDEPHRAIREATGLEVGSDASIRFVEGLGATTVIVLRAPVRNEGELTDDDLDLAAGGTGEPPESTW